MTYLKFLFFIFFIFQNFLIKTFEESNKVFFNERLNKIFHINQNISKYFNKKNIINILYSDLLIKYFGLDIENQNDSLFDLKLIYGLEQIDLKLTENEKYYFDNLLNFIIEKSKLEINEINEEKLLKIINLSFLNSCIFPSKKSFFIYEYIKNYRVSDKVENFINEISSSLNFLFYEIGTKNEFYLYKDFEKNFEKILNNKNYKLYNIILFFSDFNLVKNKNKNLDLFLKTISIYNKNKKLKNLKNLENIFNIYIDDLDFVLESIKFFLKKDNLYNLFVLGRIGKNNNIDLFEIKENEKNILFNYGALARFILDNLFQILGEKKINWEKLDSILFSRNRLNDILIKISLFGSMDLVYGDLFYKAYSKKILNII